MDQLKTIIFLLLISQPIFATNLCDNSCELTITFPDGGSIEATEPLTFTFGTGGLLNLGETGTVNTTIQQSSIDYSTGGTLSLSTGESISFDSNGSLDLGSGGNFDYTSISISGPITANISAMDGTETVSLSSLIIFGDSTFNFDAKLIEILDLTSDSSVTINGSDTDNSFIIGSVSVQTLNLNGGSGSDTFDISSTLPYGSNTSFTGENSTGIMFTTDSINDPILITSPTINFSDSTNGWTLNSVTPTELTGFNYENPTFLQETFLSVNGLGWVVDGESCILAEIDEVIYCDTDNGKTYKLVNGEWVEMDASGSLNVLTVLLVGLLTLLSRRITIEIKKG